MAKNITIKDIPKDLQEQLEQSAQLAKAGSTGLALGRGQGRGFLKAIVLACIEEALPKIHERIATEGPAFLLSKG